jgi:erythromycin esterase-like protein
MADATLEAVRDAALWFEAGTDGLGPLLEAIGDASLVLIGEASHGTHEFYRIRADLTAALIERKGFNLVAAEADWPDAYRASRWVRLMSDDADADAALGSFTRFPRWMWRNDVVVDFLQWPSRPQCQSSSRATGRLLWARSVQPAQLDGSRAPVSGSRGPGGGPAGARSLRLLRAFRD